MKSAPAPSPPKKRVLIVDDHPLLRDGLAKVLNQQVDLMVCGEAGDVSGGLAALSTCRPDVVIVDLSLGEGNGLDLIKAICARNAKLPILVLSMHNENLYAERAVRAGARGYVMKREPVGAVVAALRKVLAGHMALSENIVTRLLATPELKGAALAGAPSELLSDRELDVFRCYGEGRNTREIAARLGIAPSTVESHRAGIKRKLKLDNATELVSAASRFLADETRT
jgi:DNA-binding NarL/FixJ family response regulator